MLIRFTVENYLSFDGKQEFTTYKGRPRSKEDHVIQSGKLNLLKFSAIYGANASGKSNLVKAMAASQWIILHGFSPMMSNEYFKLNPANKNKPTSFEYEIEIDDKYYAYGFDIILSEGKIIGEWLYEIHPGKEDELIYEREPASEDQPYKLGNNYDKGDGGKVIEIYLKGMKSNMYNLFLQDMNSGKHDVFDSYPNLRPIQTVFRWFVEKLRIGKPGFQLASRPFYMRDNFDLKLTDKIIPSLGLGIEKVTIKDDNPDELDKYLPSEAQKELMKKLSEDINEITRVNGVRPDTINITFQAKKEFVILELSSEPLKVKSLKLLQFIHTGEDDTPFGFAEESDGTRIMLNLVEILLAAYNNSDNVFVFDEIDRGLHPLLSHRLVELFLELSKGKTQLIATTHESHLMDLDMLRQDEIWFITKHRSGYSEIYSLDQYKERFDKRLVKAYLKGLYGGVPVMDLYVPLVDEREEE